MKTYGNIGALSGQITEKMDDATTLEPSESGLGFQNPGVTGFNPGFSAVKITNIAPYPHAVKEVKISTILQSSKFTSANITGMRNLAPKSTCVFPLEAPPIHYKFNNTAQYRH